MLPATFSEETSVASVKTTAEKLGGRLLASAAEQLAS
jgi:hypothetical protein